MGQGLRWKGYNGDQLLWSSRTYMLGQTASSCTTWVRRKQEHSLPSNAASDTWSSFRVKVLGAGGQNSLRFSGTGLLPTPEDATKLSKPMREARTSASVPLLPRGRMATQVL